MSYMRAFGTKASVLAHLAGTSETHRGGFLDIGLSQRYREHVVRYSLHKRPEPTLKKSLTPPPQIPLLDALSISFVMSSSPAKWTPRKPEEASPAGHPDSAPQITGKFSLSPAIWTARDHEYAALYASNPDRATSNEQPPPGVKRIAPPERQPANPPVKSKTTRNERPLRPLLPRVERVPPTERQQTPDRAPRNERPPLRVEKTTPEHRPVNPRVKRSEPPPTTVRSNPPPYRFTHKSAILVPNVQKKVTGRKEYNL